MAWLFFLKTGAHASTLRRFGKGLRFWGSGGLFWAQWVAGAALDGTYRSYGPSGVDALPPKRGAPRQRDWRLNAWPEKTHLPSMTTAPQTNPAERILMGPGPSTVPAR